MIFNLNNNWIPPFFLFVAGRERIASRRYYHDVSETPPPRRILVKHTLSGEGVLYVNDRRYVLGPDSLFVIDRPGPYRYGYEGNGEVWNFEFFSIGLTGSEAVLPQSLGLDPVMSLEDHPELKSQLRELIKLRLDPDYCPRLHHSFLSYAFLMTYISARLEHKKIIPAVVLDLLKVLHAGTRSRLDIGKCCCDLGYTPEALSRLFKKFIGVPPGRYLQHRRLVEVCELLRESRLSIKEIAQFCGFESPDYLGRVFKQVLGCTPGQYRNNPDLLLLESIAKVSVTSHFSG
ncbi:MAG: AraC family transcriptional regulator [Victivallaceae bacterium]|nr:AraC family transcriptional regulator [Victivallaceae bacterium]